MYDNPGEIASGSSGSIIDSKVDQVVGNMFVPFVCLGGKNPRNQHFLNIPWNPLGTKWVHRLVQMMFKWSSTNFPFQWGEHVRFQNVKYVQHPKDPCMEYLPTGRYTIHGAFGYHILIHLIPVSVWCFYCSWQITTYIIPKITDLFGWTVQGVDFWVLHKPTTSSGGNLNRWVGHLEKLPVSKTGVLKVIDSVGGWTIRTNLYLFEQNIMQPSKLGRIFPQGSGWTFQKMFELPPPSHILQHTNAIGPLTIKLNHSKTDIQICAMLHCRNQSFKKSLKRSIQLSVGKRPPQPALEKNNQWPCFWSFNIKPTLRRIMSWNVNLKTPSVHNTSRFGSASWLKIVARKKHGWFVFRLGPASYRFHFGHMSPYKAILNHVLILQKAWPGWRFDLVFSKGGCLKSSLGVLDLFSWWFFMDCTIVNHHFAPPFGRILVERARNASKFSSPAFILAMYYLCKGCTPKNVGMFHWNSKSLIGLDHKVVFVPNVNKRPPKVVPTFHKIQIDSAYIPTPSLNARFRRTWTPMNPTFFWGVASEKKNTLGQIGTFPQCFGVKIKKNVKTTT